MLCHIYFNPTAAACKPSGAARSEGVSCCHWSLGWSIRSSWLISAMSLRSSSEVLNTQFDLWNYIPDHCSLQKKKWMQGICCREISYLSAFQTELWLPPFLYQRFATLWTWVIEYCLLIPASSFRQGRWKGLKQPRCCEGRSNCPIYK